MNIDKITPTQDNVLLQFRHAAELQKEKWTPGGILLPQSSGAPESGSAIEATVIACGPGHYMAEWLGAERGEGDSSSRFIPMNPEIRPGVKVLCNAQALAADKLYSDDRHEYRMCREHCIEAVITED